MRLLFWLVLNEAVSYSVHTLPTQTPKDMSAAFLRFVSGALAALFLASCVAYDDPYYGGYSGGYSSSYYQSTPSYGSSYYSRPSYGSSYYNRPYYGGGYSSYTCSRCRRNPCSCSRGSHYGHSHHDHDHYRRSSSSSSRSSSSSSNRSPSGQLKNDKGNLLYRYSGGGRGAPEGNHTKDWYSERGYDLKKLKPSTKPAR